MLIYYFILYFYLYGFIGWCTEVAYATIREKRFVNRGFLNGPICPVYGLGVGTVVFLLASREWSIAALYVVSTVLVTAIEGVTGYLMDKLFHHKWWDYSNQPLNIGGYVCLIFSLAWGVACVLIIRVIHPFVHEVAVLIPVTAGTILMAVLSIALAADIYTTTAEILKLNRKLEAMEKISEELKEISNQLGENIHENVMGTMERSEGQMNRLEEKIGEGLPADSPDTVFRELRKKSAELKERYAELLGRSSLVTRRLVSAFPKMESRFYKERLNELKRRIRRK